MARKKTRFPHRSSSDEGLGGVAAVGAGRDDTKHCQDSTRRELLRSVPAAEAVGVILHQEGQVIDTLPNHLAIRKKTHQSFLSDFPTVCLSRACLGKTINFSMKSGAKHALSDLITGAEKPRRTESTGGLVRPGASSNVKSCSACESSSSVVPTSSAPVSPSSKPASTGIRNGRFTGCPGVGGQLCARLSVAFPEAASYFSSDLTVGVPDCRYLLRPILVV